TYLGHRAAGLYRRSPGREALRWLVDRLPTSTGKVTLEFLLKQFVAGADRPLIERHLTWFGALGPDARVLAWAGGLLNGFPGDSSLNRVLWLDFVTYLPDNLLVKVDRGTMLASIEARAPYLDREVMELILPAPSSVKVHRFSAKAILKEAARGLVPGPVIRRRKRGRSVPGARWLNTELAPLADRLLRAPRLGAERVPRLLSERRAGRANHAGKLWPILLAKALLAVDELCGFLVACALVRPSRSLGDLEVASVKKKLKDKAFARGVNRDEVRQGAEELGVPLDEHIAFVIQALRRVEGTLGL